MFPPFRLDPVNAQLWHGDKEINLRRKTFDVLLYLVDHPGQLVTKTMLLDAVWPGVVVSDSVPATSVVELRRALGDEAKSRRFIETVHRRGYRFIAPVTTRAAARQGTRKSSQVKRLEPLMVGREEEVAKLQRLYSRVSEGQRLILFVSGEAGIGKTTFVQAFLDSIAQESAVRIGRGQCVEQYGSGEPYMPVLEALSRLSHGEGGDQVIEILDKFAPTWLAQMPELLTREERIRLQSETKGVTQQRMLREITLALEALAAETPVVLLLEDLHWSDFSTLDLISAIARRTESARMLIVGTYRPVEILAGDHPLRTMKQELELHKYCEELRLKLLSEKDVADYLARRLASDGSRQFGTLAPLIHARTDGNPLFMINMLDYLLGDAGLLVRARQLSESEWAETLRAHRLDALRSIRQMIERNVERLHPAEQAVLESASVAGAEFSAAAVAAALERPVSEIEASCTRLARNEQFIRFQSTSQWPDGTVAGSYAFLHALYSEVLYERIPPGQRAQSHNRIAVREESAYGEQSGEIAAELANHFSCANDKSRAIRYLRLAGERATARGAMVEAEDHYSRALKLLGELPQGVERDRVELALQMTLGNVLWSSRSWAHPEASRAFMRALELAEQLGEIAQVVAALKGLIVSALGEGQYKLACELAERMLRAADRSGEHVSVCAAHSFLGQALFSRARYVEAQRHFEFATNYNDEADPIEPPLMGIDALALGAIAVLLLGFPGRARQLMNEALRRMGRRGHRFWAGLMHMWGAMFSALLCDGEAVLEHANALRRLADTQPVWTGLADLNMGRALMLQGRYEEVAAYLRKANVYHKAIGLLSQLMWAKLDEAECLLNQRMIDDGLAVAAQAYADSEELAHIRCPALRLRADLLARSNADASTIHTAYRTAIDCARSQSARYYELQAATHFARWLKTQGEIAVAKNLLAEIYGWFTEGFDTPALKEAKALLDSLSN